MNQPKFRAWDSKNKKMLYSGFCIIPTLPHWGVTEYWDESNELGFDCSAFNWADSDLITDTYVLMQFIGLTDKTKKDIYEGDIINFDQTLIGEKCIIKAEVAWIDDLTLAPMPGFGLWVAPNRGWRPMDIGEYEIIGNIYENPELLKKAKKNAPEAKWAT